METFAAVPHVQRVGFLAYLPGILRRLGLDPEEVLRDTGLDVSSLDDPNGVIAYTSMGQLVELAAQRCKCPHLGLEIGAHIRTASLGLPGQLMRNSSTLREALHTFAANQHRNAHGGVVYVLEQEHTAVFGYAVYQPNMPGYEIVCDGAALAAYNLLKELVEIESPNELDVLLSRSEPVDLRPYEVAFEIKPSFNSEQTAVIFPRRWLDKPITGANIEMKRNLEVRISRMPGQGKLDLQTQLHRELRVALVRGVTSSSEVAHQLGMSRWTFDRRLAECGLRFHKSLNHARYTYAQQLLAKTRLPIADIAAIVGFSNPSALTNGFTKHIGIGPSAWREQTLGEPRHREALDLQNSKNNGEARSAIPKTQSRK
jgi:AraC-like DNA-binding protein